MYRPAENRDGTVALVFYASASTEPDTLAKSIAHASRQRGRPVEILVVLEDVTGTELRSRARRTLDAVRGTAARAALWEPVEPPTVRSAIARCSPQAAHFALLGPGDLLRADAVAELVNAADRTGAEVVYADSETVTDDALQVVPQRKPAWSPDYLLSHPYLGQPALYAASLAPALDVVTLQGSGQAVEYDLALRGSEISARFHHVPRILCQRSNTRGRMGSGDGSTGSEVALEQWRALERSVARRGLDAKVELDGRGDGFRLRYRIANRPLVTIIIPTRDRPDLLEPCLRSLADSTTYPHHEVLLVDHGSRDGRALELMRSSGHHVLRDEGRFNFSRLNNLAARHARGDYLLFVNNDTRVITPGWIEALLEHAQRREVGAVGAKLVFPDGRIQHSGVGYLRRRAVHVHEVLGCAEEAASSGAVRNFSAVTGACMMTRRDLFLSMGGFDEGFTVAYGDVDYCFRLRSCGYFIVFTPHAVLEHQEGSTRGYGRQPRRDDLRLRWQWLRRLPPDPYLGAASRSA